MVALSQMLPRDPDEREAVRRVLREHPNLEAFIERLSRHALATFPAPSCRSTPASTVIGTRRSE